MRKPKGKIVRNLPANIGGIQLMYDFHTSFHGSREKSRAFQKVVIGYSIYVYCRGHSAHAITV
jgi:hypothetical protein